MHFLGSGVDAICASRELTFSNPASRGSTCRSFDDNGAPEHEGGVVANQPGLYFVGLNFLFSMSSSMIHGVGRDAARITSHLAARRGLV